MLIMRADMKMIKQNPAMIQKEKEKTEIEIEMKLSGI
jgi:hypothetical protein